MAKYRIVMSRRTNIRSIFPYPDGSRYSSQYSLGDGIGILLKSEDDSHKVLLGFDEFNPVWKDLNDVFIYDSLKTADDVSDFLQYLGFSEFLVEEQKAIAYIARHRFSNSFIDIMDYFEVPIELFLEGLNVGPGFSEEDFKDLFPGFYAK